MWAEKGQQVKFLGRNGYDMQLEQANALFPVGKVLTVSRTDVEAWSSSYEFEEVPGKWFNTVMFEPVSQAPEKEGDNG